MGTAHRICRDTRARGQVFDMVSYPAALFLLAFTGFIRHFLALSILEGICTIQQRRPIMLSQYSKCHPFYPIVKMADPPAQVLAWIEDDLQDYLTLPRPRNHVLIPVDGSPPALAFTGPKPTTNGSAPSSRGLKQRPPRTQPPFRGRRSQAHPSTILSPLLPYSPRG